MGNILWKDQKGNSKLENYFSLTFTQSLQSCDIPVNQRTLCDDNVQISSSRNESDLLELRTGIGNGNNFTPNHFQDLPLNCVLYHNEISHSVTFFANGYTL